MAAFDFNEWSLRIRSHRSSAAPVGGLADGGCARPVML